MAYIETVFIKDSSGNALNSNGSGALTVDGSAVTQPVSGTVTVQGDALSTLAAATYGPQIVLLLERILAGLEAQNRMLGSGLEVYEDTDENQTSLN